MAPGLNLNLDPQAPAYWQEACTALALQSPVWAELVNRHTDRALRSRGAPYETMLRSLVGQQISVKAAEAVWLRVVQALNGELSSQALLALNDDILKATGLSRQKIAYSRALSEFEQKGLLELNLLDSMDDEACTRHLCEIKGVGRWTAQMFLMFCLRRPDVWPVDDIGVQRGISRQFFEGEPIGPKEALQFGEKLKPWRTVAAWYLWRSLDPVVVDY
ncbi:MAG: DNA-3-methyladenine glycosylase 2 family protein [Limnobacter sp.]|uniref:DNA-3-methyladenine glycosylase family protein n=1 Tax=Limnobacter sp. TaxID=2003368 RepID=UPI0022CA2B2F|nr:DNA-3-methyladenine glycosylase 2 family protein [Limnobacter sp.]MCZ8015693.1 DNA-3-methyladenine glycosylase 2 family protein [Limnobacter sp.]